jgi:ribosome-associated protein
VSKKKNGSAPPSEKLKDSVVNALDQDKAEEIVTIDLAGKTSIADYMVIASGRSARQITALAEKISEHLKEHGIKPRIEGRQSGDWILVDGGDIIIHLFRPEVRKFYSIEDIWNVTYPSDKLQTP